MLTSFAEACMSNIITSAEFARAYLEELKKGGTVFQSNVTGREIDLSKLSDKDVQNLAYQVCRKLGALL